MWLKSIAHSLGPAVLMRICVQLAGQSDTGSRGKEGVGPVFQNGKAKESRVSKNAINLLKMVATMKPSIASERV